MVCLLPHAPVSLTQTPTWTHTHTQERKIVEHREAVFGDAGRISRHYALCMDEKHSKTINDQSLLFPWASPPSIHEPAAMPYWPGVARRPVSTLAHRLTVIHFAPSGLASSTLMQNISCCAPHPASGVTRACQITLRGNPCALALSGRAVNSTKRLHSHTLHHCNWIHYTSSGIHHEQT